MITKFKIFEKLYIPVNDLDDLKLVLDIPQVGSKIFDYNIENDTIIISNDDFKPFEIYDFVVLSDGKLVIGRMHYKISGKSKLIKAAGELKLDDNGKIIYLNNQSGHYKPTSKTLYDIKNKFNSLNLLHSDVKVQELF